ncbi:MAG: phosphate transport system permease protein [Cryptosporangiaceae bacterium]|jgi:phosphate transport system permease protein|nr:phosphate transport system permease protein [Cryptosporangiaceae bacterium]
MTENPPSPGATIGAAGSAHVGASTLSGGPSLISGASVRRGDRVFRGLSVAASASVLAIMAAIAAFLVSEAVPALTKNDANFLTETKWFPDPSTPGGPVIFGIASLAIDTLVSSLVAMAVAVPVAIGIALFTAYYAPRRLARPLAYLVDLLAAVPSIVYGLWGFFFFKNHLGGLVLWLDRWFGWTGLFHYRPSALPGNQSLFTAGLVLAIMILPIISAISREVFVQVPRQNIEAALALGATRWEMIRISVLPFGRAGVTSASILGLGRALGETLAVALILTQVYDINLHITENGGITFASNIALKIGEAEDTGTGALIASGLVLFVITLAVNSVAQILIRRSNVEA